MTSKNEHNGRTIVTCLALSLLVHLICAAPLDFFKPFDLGAPVQLNQAIIADLRGPVAAAPAEQSPGTPEKPKAEAPAKKSAKAQAEHAPAVPEQQSAAPPAAKSANAPAEQLAASPPATALPFPDSAHHPDPRQAAAPAEERQPKNVKNDAPARSARQTGVPPSTEESFDFATEDVEGQYSMVSAVAQPLRNAGEFLSADRETLCYRISMLGIPVGSAELEAKKVKGEVRITLRIQSNATISQIYSVDDSIETRHIGGNFILSRIRQREGSFRGDRGFTLFLRQKSVFWIDRQRNRSIQEPLPNSAVVDILSGLYYLRNQPLEVGTTVLLELFDSDRYAPTNVAVLRKEHLTLPGQREVDTLLVHPELKTEGIFKRTGEIMVWLTDDEKRVPVKVETSIVLGKVTAELISAETYSEPPVKDSRRKKQVVEVTTSMVAFGP